MFSLRAIELAALEIRGATFGGSAGLEYVRIFIRRSKTDQEWIDARRSLNASKGESRPSAMMKTWTARTTGKPRDNPVFGPDILIAATCLVNGQWWNAIDHLAGFRLARYERGVPLAYTTPEWANGTPGVSGDGNLLRSIFTYISTTEFPESSIHV